MVSLVVIDARPLEDLIYRRVAVILPHVHTVLGKNRGDGCETHHFKAPFRS